MDSGSAGPLLFKKRKELNMPLWVKIIFLFWVFTQLLIWFVPRILSDEDLYMASEMHIGPAMPWLVLVGACVILCVLSIPVLIVWLLFFVFA